MNKNDETALGITANTLMEFALLILQNKKDNIKTIYPELAIKTANELLDKLELLTQVKL